MIQLDKKKKTIKRVVRNKIGLPGPGHYTQAIFNPSRICTIGKQTRFKIFRRQIQSPGPGEYRHDNSFSKVRMTTPSHQFSRDSRHQQKKSEDTPSPFQYKLKDTWTQKSLAPKFGLSLRNSLSDKQLINVSPFSYTISSPFDKLKKNFRKFTPTVRRTQSNSRIVSQIKEIKLSKQSKAVPTITKGERPLSFLVPNSDPFNPRLPKIQNFDQIIQQRRQWSEARRLRIRQRMVQERILAKMQTDQKQHNK